ncbi:MAG: SEC-C metal-binding domain-containing protein [bacterium]
MLLLEKIEQILKYYYMGRTRRNDPCPCGSGKKYKHCCYQKNYIEVTPEKKTAYFTLDDGSKISQSITSLDAMPTHNKNGLTPNITSAQMMDMCLDEI